ncbi:hypothetical protein [Paraburkholderia bryophila]|jgi:hypothetical protein|uniref:Uncharacterized protein n=1 Tax=Paraburkholderia bryophila TaxID=420952 RepID=A0A329BMR4_9BURK|nr:hypothetical protein [Paraburkholderia bryophila]RAS22631.1 hypothetical protein BX591_12396 [Paraburkholderia bryophila]
MSTQTLEKERVIAPENQVKESLAVDWRKYDGERVIASTGGPIYLVLNGELQWIPNPETYNNLFASWNGVVVSDYLVDNVPRGPALTSGAVLAKGNGAPQEYLVSNGTKQWIPDPATFKKFAFNASKVVTVPQIIIDYVPSGRNIG